MTELNANTRHHARPHQRPGSQSTSRQAWRYAVAGLSASLVGLGLARFSYTPLIPALIAAKWFSASDVVYLGAANLAGYLAGALAARALATRIGAVRALRVMMLLATLSFFASSTPVSFAWFFACRFLSGLTGGIIMVLAASVILPHVSAARRGIVGGVIFAGVGLGVAASGTLVPLLLQQGLQQSWYGLGVLSAVLTLASWWNWPAEAKSDAAPSHHAKSHQASPAVRALLVQYGLNAVALVPHMVFIVDFVARGLGQGIAAGSRYWVLYGLGAIVGPLVTGHLGDRSGFGPALRAAFLIEAAAVLLPTVSTAPLSLIVSSVVVGGFTPGIVPLVLGRIHELVPHSTEQQRATWSHATTSFALFQAAAAYGFSWIYAQTGGDYLVLFGLGGAAVVLALAIDLGLALTTRKA
ncbi:MULTISPECIES: YbfB/YjiJ family MFS transporter [Bradyrhizobium]|uniref:YbfB/YjiJ family MFS transporter n=1 Tax=Bradyrhizobium TaxID=374 RepID=UPI000231CC41|nr:YbfB/YjiJ family MFS transporter [Bradyrhizobium japonicum]AJA66690.1 membrane protein [Bradyrhizobium japonicum]KMK00763.1 membrane protein [Bradyrhizobium japonicum]MBR0759484.1 MFS transporter [Bradyrhizobium japonicum]MCP1764477.1 putative MFS family arabinose efflux permease [Bradyrhizobium japonicum]MCP1786613.1 putative MFS family arabinose efflux permease [Bradyrhizobium japonicum]